MPASPMLRVEFEDGSAVEVQSNLWLYFSGSAGRAWKKARFMEACMFAVGDMMHPDGPQQPGRVVKSITRLPYKNARKKGG